MSVLKNQRRLSRSEFEYNYCLFYAEYADRVNRTSKRRMKWVGKPLLNAMNNALQSILNVNQYRFAKGDNIDKKIKSVNKAIDDIYNIQKPLLTYFNIEVLPFNKQVRCVEFLSKEVELLSDITNQTERCCKFLVIDYESVHKMKFIENMCELHRLTHSKLIRATGNLENTETPILANLIDSVIFHNDKEYLKELYHGMKSTAESLGLRFNEKKTRIVKISNGFKFLKIHYSVDGRKIIRTLDRTTVTRQRNKLKKFRKMVDNGKMSLDDVYNSMQSWLAHCKYASHSYHSKKSMLKIYNELFDGYKITKQYEKYNKPKQNGGRETNELLQSYKWNDIYWDCNYNRPS